MKATDFLKYLQTRVKEIKAIKNMANAACRPWEFEDGQHSEIIRLTKYLIDSGVKFGDTEEILK